MITSVFRIVSILLLANLINAFEKVHFNKEAPNFESLGAFDTSKVLCNYENDTQKLFLNANCKIDKVELYNILGKPIASHLASNDFLEINLSDLNSGSYYGKVFCNNSSKVFVVRK
jgi:hypothetical protein